MSKSTDSGDGLYTNETLRQLISAAVEDTVAGFELLQEFEDYKGEYGVGIQYTGLGNKYGISRETIKKLMHRVSGSIHALPQRKIKKTIRKIKVEIGPETVKVAVFVVLFGLVLGLAGHSDATACEVSRGIICP